MVMVQFLIFTLLYKHWALAMYRECSRRTRLRSRLLDLLRNLWSDLVQNSPYRHRGLSHGTSRAHNLAWLGLLLLLRYNLRLLDLYRLLYL